MKWGFISAIVVASALLLTCRKSDSVTGPSPGSQYFNSFEAPSDTSGWTGYGFIQLRADAPPGGGKQSLYVAGGCMAPHFVMTLPGVYQQGHYELHCWGKRVVNVGGVALKVPGARCCGNSITVMDSVWKFYISSTRLYLPSEAQLQLEMDSGGFVAGGMLVDLVEVVKVD